MSEHLKEEMLPDDYPVHLDYLYVGDGKVVRNDLIEGTVGDLKRKTGLKKISLCNLCVRHGRLFYVEQCECCPECQTKNFSAKLGYCLKCNHGNEKPND